MRDDVLLVGTIARGSCVYSINTSSEAEVFPLPVARTFEEDSVEEDCSLRGTVDELSEEEIEFSLTRRREDGGSEDVEEDGEDITGGC